MDRVAAREYETIRTLASVKISLPDLIIWIESGRDCQAWNSIRQLVNSDAGAIIRMDEKRIKFI